MDKKRERAIIKAAFATIPPEDRASIIRHVRDSRRKFRKYTRAAGSALARALDEAILKTLKQEK